MAKSPSEQIRDLSTEVGILRERDAIRRREIEELKDSLQRETESRQAADEQTREEIAELRGELAGLRQENAVLRQQLQDHLAQYQEWGRRLWGFITVLIGAIFSLASGLIVSLSRK